MRNRNNGFLPIFILIFGLVFISNIAMPLRFIMGEIMTMLVPLIIFAVGVTMVAIGLGSKKKKNNKTKTVQSNISATELLNNLKKYFESNDVITLYDNVSIIPANKDDITFANLDIYIGEEYIATLEEFLKMFPDVYEAINSYTTSKVKKKKKTKKDEKEEKEAIIQPIVLEKNCAYYIKKLAEQSSKIDNQQVNDGIDEAVNYLKQIKKVEDEFPNCKNKTTKLYQYYLPMLSDILTSYDRLEDSASNATDFKETEDRLLKTIVLINGALKTISTTLAEDYYTEVRVDMRTLESVLKKDGLIKDDITNGDN